MSRSSTVTCSRLFPMLPVTSHNTFGRVYDVPFVESFDDRTFRPVIAAQFELAIVGLYHLLPGPVCRMRFGCSPQTISFSPFYVMARVLRIDNLWSQ